MASSFVNPQSQCRLCPTGIVLDNIGHNRKLVSVIGASVLLLFHFLPLGTSAVCAFYNALYASVLGQTRHIKTRWHFCNIWGSLCLDSKDNRNIYMFMPQFYRQPRHICPKIFMFSRYFQFLKLNTKFYALGGYLTEADNLLGLSPILTETYVITFIQRVLLNRGIYLFMPRFKINRGNKPC